MNQYNGFLTVLSGFFLAAALIFLALTYLITHPILVSLGALGAALALHWHKKNSKKKPQVKPGYKNTGYRTDREFDAWLSLKDE